MSQEHPIPDSYWVVPGKLLAGEYPGAPTEPEACRKLAILLDAGVRQFVDLTEAGEYDLRPYWPTVQQLAAERGLEVAHERMSIPDMTAPTPAHMRAVLDKIAAAIGQERPVYVHCFGGIGRTGTVVGCFLVEQGCDGREALAEIEQRRRGTPDSYRRSPETTAQREMVLTWPAN